MAKLVDLLAAAAAVRVEPAAVVVLARADAVRLDDLLEVLVRQQVARVAGELEERDEWVAYARALLSFRLPHSHLDGRIPTGAGSGRTE